MQLSWYKIAAMASLLASSVLAAPKPIDMAACKVSTSLTPRDKQMFCEYDFAYCGADLIGSFGMTTSCPSFWNAS
jgi:hypothetical protein